MVLAETLSHHSSKRVVCICDICGKEVSKVLKQYYSSLDKHNGIYICKDCFNHNLDLINQRKAQIKQTCIKKYGVDSPMKNEEVKKTLRETMKAKYGVEYSGQIKEGLEKRKNTCLEKYGVENPIVLSDNKSCHSKEAREKAINTMREKYGGVGFELEHIREKAQNTLALSGKVRFSSQQTKICEYLLELYPNAKECIFNKPLNNLSLDISLIVDDVNIDVEVDGQYWHQDYQKDRRRDEIVKKQGYKVLRIKFDHNIPTKEQLFESVQKLLKSEHNYYELILSDYKNN